ncbi:hypothetical protein Gpo141_00000248 [Globisporangium polare]
MTEEHEAHATPTSSSSTTATTATAAAPSVQAMERTGRMHSTVRLNQFTLRFEDAALEDAYQASIHKRKKALWLRSLIPAAGSHILFGLGDCIEHPIANLQVTLPARVFLAVLQISMFVLVNWDLIQAHETTMLLVSVCNGIPSLLLYALQRTSLHQWDALFVIFGLSFYTIPKITPLGFISSTCGSWATAVLYTVLSFAIRPPSRPAESVLGLFYCAPVIGIFNTISYYSEYNSRERFVLRRRLSSESISLAVARTNTLLTPYEGTDRFFKTLAHSNGPTFFFGVFLWGAFTTGGWASLPDTLKFVDEQTGWAWFSHCAGMTVFLLVMTRQLMWLFVVPVLGSVILWMMSLTMPSEWIIISAHSVGYGLLVASVIVAMGVFSWFVCAWKELVSFLTRSCFLYPQLQAGLESEYPLLVKIVSEYTAGFDPEILSSRMPASKALVGSVSTTEVRALRSGADDEGRHRHHNHHQGLLQSTTSPRRRPMRTVKAKLLVNGDAPHHRHENGMVMEYADDAELELSRPEELVRSELVSEHVDAAGKMVSVLPSFKAGKCFFCSKNDAEHFVPACGMWGKWTHWRMNQQQHGSSGHQRSGSGSLLAKPVVSMCTSYYDIQNQKSELELRVTRLEETNAGLSRQIAQVRTTERETAGVAVHLKSEMRALEDKFALDLQRHEAQWQQKMKTVLEESNRIAHERKLELKRHEASRAAQQKQIEAAKRSAEKAEASAQCESEQRANMEAQIASFKAEIESLKSALETAATAAAGTTATSQQLGSSFASATNSSMASASPVANLQTLQPSKRLPYAQFLEIEGLRESSRKRDGKTDYSESWRYAGAALDRPDSHESY